MHITSVDIYRTGCRVGVVPLSPGVYSRYACGLYLYSYILYIGNSPSAMQTLLKRTPEKFKTSFLSNFSILLTTIVLPCSILYNGWPRFERRVSHYQLSLSSY